MLKAVILDEAGNEVTSINLVEKKFKSGKQGLWGQSRTSLDGDKLQCQMLIINRSKGASGSVREVCQTCGAVHYTPA